MSYNVFTAPPSRPAVPNCATRTVQGVFTPGYRLGSSVLSSVVAADTDLILLNPTGAMRDTAPANVGFLVAGQLELVLPMAFDRLTLSAGRSDARLFDNAWASLDAANTWSGNAPVWNSGAPVGDYGVELGATGNRPNGHPWLSVATLANDLHLMVALSSRARDDEPRYQAWFDRSDLQSLAGTAAAHAFTDFRKDGAAELAHFAVLDPESAGWQQDAEMDNEAVGRIHRRFIAWPQRDGWSQCVKRV